MKPELLISAVNADPRQLIEKMGVSSDAVLINQSGKEAYEEIPVKNGVVRVFSFDEKGVGKSRNRAIEKSEGEILVFADDDIEYEENYADLIVREFEAHPEAEGLFFNVKVCPERRTYYNEDFGRVRIYNAGRYPAYSIAIKKSVLERAQIRYSLLFGGGAKYSCGEDSLFISDCIRAGIRMYRTTVCIGKEVPRTNGESTWFKGYNEKFFFDRGVLYAFLYGPLSTVMGFRFVYTKKAVMCRDIPWKKAFGILLKGIKEGKKEKKTV